MTALSVNLNKVALLRNTRSNGVPSVLHAAQIALEAGADGITVHPAPRRSPRTSAGRSGTCGVIARLAGGRVQRRGNPFHGLDGLRAASAPASMHIRAR